MWNGIIWLWGKKDEGKLALADRHMMSSSMESHQRVQPKIMSLHFVMRIPVCSQNPSWHWSCYVLEGTTVAMEFLSHKPFQDRSEAHLSQANVGAVLPGSLVYSLLKFIPVCWFSPFTPTDELGQKRWVNTQSDYGGRFFSCGKETQRLFQGKYRPLQVSFLGFVFWV